MPSRSTGIRLPQTLLDQLNDTSDTVSRSRQGRGGPHRPKLTRKEARKQGRTEKKQRKADFFTSVNANEKRASDAPHPESPPSKKAKLAEPARSRNAELQGSKNSAKPSSSKDSSKKPKDALRKTSSKALERSIPIPLRSRQEEDEDRYIAYLESKLGSGKRTKKGTVDYSKDFDEDGLGGERFRLRNVIESQSSSELGSKADDPKDVEVDVGEESSGGSGLDDAEEWHGFSDPADDEAASGEEKPASGAQAASANELPTTRYVPPHLRAKSAGNVNAEDNANLNRQLKGLLNKLSEQNIANILNDIEAVYREHRRHDVTASITSLVIDSISSHSMLLDSYVVLHAAFISSLHRIVGIEFGGRSLFVERSASFVQNVVASYEQHYAAVPSSSAEDSKDESLGKECSNLIVLLSELYNLQVISCVLIYDVIRNLLSAELTEFVVELLLKLLRNSGHQLRQDDPSALKDIVQIVQSKTADSEKHSSSRTRFMLETLINLKNNKVKKSAAQHAGGDAVDRMKKFLTGLGKKRHLMAHDPLRITLDDLHSAESRGKWWLVGAAWSGDPLVERQDEAKREVKAHSEDAVENALLKLAKKQGMNTDIRRSIFVVLMSSDDYVDACERLAQLNLTEVQQRDVVRVLLNCCGNEKTYNPYYTFVCQHLCKTSHSYKITLQFCLWDFLRDLGEASVGGAEVIKNLKDVDDASEAKDISSTKMRNVAKAYAWWVAKDCVTLTVFKPVDFTMLKPRTRKFLSYFFQQLFISSQVSTPVLGNTMPSARDKGPVEEIFIKATRVETLAMGLAYIITEMKKSWEDEFVRWAGGVAVDTLRVGLDIIPTL
ncbi:hypothetical protein BC834DRAFT_924661 [Gloeopeniophorella convolvens]|nr:hypothetical protein BC834DRAFT_924661 [Gloeopeniophorella convolvens]